MIKLEEFKKIVTEKIIVFDPFPHVTLVISRLEHFPYCHIPKRLKIIVVKMRQILMLPLDSIFAKCAYFRHKMYYLDVNLHPKTIIKQLECDFR